MSTRLVLTVAYTFDGWTEIGGNNRGQAVERFLKHVALEPGQPWCAAWVAYVGYYGCYDYATKKSYWPLPKTGGCAYLGDVAKGKSVLVAMPEPGDVFLVYFPSLKRFAHTGFCVSANTDGSWVTIEGNTSGGGSREGWGVFERTRTFDAADRFIRWRTLLPEARRA